MAQAGQNIDRSGEMADGPDATSGTRSGVSLVSACGHPSQTAETTVSGRIDEVRGRAVLPAASGQVSQMRDVRDDRPCSRVPLTSAVGQLRQTVRTRDRQASFLGGNQDDSSSFLASAGESEYTVIRRDPVSVDRYQLFATPVEDSPRLTESALRRHNEIMSPNFGRMQGMIPDDSHVLRSVSQASSRRTTSSIARLEQNQMLTQEKLEQNQRMMEQMMNLRLAVEK